ncbi:PREDICTED: uncharacterized protein LOC109584021 [Amphimedon queenslandica]|uniref:Death domain-containing protein n=1 Tax=Amphimedon queenslandica TaxID=400682 RepID=A0A1X7UAZ6_AMPQE|nr:PREDICTED: uncharacterized protein LOC109584021 [Amphimedon queenslandica]|eukprot:XP_019855142.1 PREDICTED: uncharacterized protein LOC109584021 [Amphimedon queenslandica]
MASLFASDLAQPDLPNKAREKAIFLEEALATLRRDGFDPSKSSPYQLGEELGLNTSLSHIDDYLRLLDSVCMVLGFTKKETAIAMSNVCLKVVLTLWLKEVDNVSERGRATKTSLKRAIDKVKGKASFSGQEMLNTDATVTIRYTNLLLCGLPGSGRSSFLRLLLGSDSTAPVPPVSIARMMMRTPESRLSDRSYEWKDSTFEEIIASHFNEASDRPADPPEHSIPLSSRRFRNETSFEPFEPFLFRSLNQLRQLQMLLVKRMGKESRINLHKEFSTGRLQQHQDLLLRIRNADEDWGYISSCMYSTYIRDACVLSQPQMIERFQLFQGEKFFAILYSMMDDLSHDSKEFEHALREIIPLLSSYQSDQPKPNSIPHPYFVPHSPPHISSSSTSVSRPVKGISHILSAPKPADKSTIHFVNVITTRGPLSFLSTIPAVLNYTAVNLITHRLDAPLHESNFDGTIRGTAPIDMLDDLVRSLNFPQKPPLEGIIAHVNPEYGKKKLLVVGTCLDLIDKEKLSSCNKVLDKYFDNLRDVFLRDANSIVFALNNLNKTENEDRKLRLIRRKVCNQYIEAQIPGRWILLKQELLVRAQRQTELCPVDDLIEVGKSFQMTEADVKSALSFFHSMTFIFYFPAFIPDFVFLNPEGLLEKLFELTKIQKTELKADRLMQMDFAHAPGILPYLLERLLLILRNPLSSDSFLFPCSLEQCQSLSHTRRRLYPVDPLVLSWQLQVPQGLFQALCIHLASSVWGFPLYYYYYQNVAHFRDEKRNMHVTLIEHRCSWIEVYNESDDASSCSSIKEDIYKSMQAVLDLFNINISIIPPLTEHFFCFEHDANDHLCAVGIEDDKDMVTCLLDGSASFSITDRQKPWLEIKLKLKSFEASKPLNISNLSDILLLLRRSHFSGKWQNLGLMLGLSINTIKHIEMENRSNAERCLTESLAAWLKSVDGASAKDINFGSLASALEQMGENASAHTIHESLSK